MSAKEFCFFFFFHFLQLIIRLLQKTETSTHKRNSNTYLYFANTYQQQQQINQMSLQNTPFPFLFFSCQPATITENHMGKLDLGDYPCEERKKVATQGRLRGPSAAGAGSQPPPGRRASVPGWAREGGQDTAPSSLGATQTSSYTCSHFLDESKAGKVPSWQHCQCLRRTGWKEAIRLPSAGEGNWGEELWSSTEKATVPAGGRKGRQRACALSQASHTLL